MSSTATRDPLLSYDAAATRSGPEFKRRQIKHWVERGWIKPTRIGQRTFVRQSELDRFLVEGAPPAPRKSEAH